MPYSGPDDKNLPDNVKKLPAPKRAQWVGIFNDTHANCMSKNKGGGAGTQQKCETLAFRFANGVATKEFEEMEIAEKAAVTKIDGGTNFVASDYADVPDAKMPSTWKLRLAEGSSGNFTVAQVARAITAMQPGGFRGQQVEIGTSKAEVVSKITAAINKIEGADETQKKNLQERLSGVKILEEEKCGPETCAESRVQAYGGAQSFQDADSYMEILQETDGIRSQTQMFRSLIDNVLEDEDLTLAQKATKITAASAELSGRVANPPKYKAIEVEEEEKAGKRINKGWLDQIKASVGVLTKLLNWGDYNDEDLAAAQKIDESEVPAEGGFKVYRDKAGALRWLAFSSNAFKDKEGEIFGTKALENAVAEADKTGKHGVLRLYHVPGCDVGTCDFQEVVGRVLVESGIFDTTERGRKAATHFEETIDEHGISIGYRYLKGDREDAVYDWLEIFERSVAPKEAVANSWTTFKTVGGVMDARKKEFLEKVLGEDLTKEVIASAETLTKELEGQSVAYKVEGLSEVVEAITDPEAKAKVVAALADLEQPLPEDKKDVVSDPGGHLFTSSGGEQMMPDALAQLAGTIKDAIAPLAEAISGVETRLTSIEEAQKTQTAKLEEHATELEGLKTSDDDKVAGLFQARSRSPSRTPASADSGNIVDPESELGKAAKTAGEGAKDPAAPYVTDLLAGAGVQR